MTRCFQCGAEIPPGHEATLGDGKIRFTFCPRCAPGAARPASSSYAVPVPSEMPIPELDDAPPPLSPPPTFNLPMAFLAGGVAAGVGGLLWYVVLLATATMNHTNPPWIGMATLIMGFIVAVAVVKGSGDYHGLPSQLIVMGLILATLFIVQLAARVTAGVVFSPVNMIFWGVTLVEGYYIASPDTPVD